MEETEFSKFTEFKLYPVTEGIAVGMKFIDFDNYKSLQEDVVTNHNDAVSVTDEQKELGKLAKNYLVKLELKINTRSKIRAFKDFEDDFADNKLLIESIFMYMIEDWTEKSDQEKASFPFGDIMDAFIQSIDGKSLRSQQNLDGKKIAKIIQDEAIISKIVKDNYLEKIKNL